MPYTKEIKCLDHGFVRYVDHMGSDQRIVEAARVSYHSASKGEESDKKLISYLWKNKHCYHPDMQVLTADGWKAWRSCSNREIFMVPDNGVLRREKLDVVSFDVAEEKMCTFKSQRMSYVVTSDHRMLFKPKQDEEFKIIRAFQMSHWGHFKKASDFKMDDCDGLDNGCPKMRFVGFFLGDGCGESERSAVFHFRKTRKIKYLRSLCSILGMTLHERPSSTHADGVVMRVRVPSWMDEHVDVLVRGDSKHLKTPLSELCASEISGLLSGLVNSDGSVKKNRPQIEFSSKSRRLADLFQNCAAMVGMDGHFCSTSKGVFSVKAYKNGRTSLEARKPYFGTSTHTGKVFCATTSTGLLVVRGSETEFGFICGNTSPFEMCKVTLNIKMPIFVMRQYVRHRMQNLNEVSARYTELPEEFYIPDKWRAQDTKNKQSSVESDLKMVHARPVIDVDGSEFMTCDPSLIMRNHCKRVYQLYQDMIESGIAREMARFVLPVNIYTECYACWDLKNLMHFISLRDDSHAQAEIQVYGKAIKEICTDLFPWTMEAFSKFKFQLVES